MNRKPYLKHTLVVVLTGATCYINNAVASDFSLRLGYGAPHYFGANSYRNNDRCYLPNNNGPYQYRPKNYHRGHRRHRDHGGYRVDNHTPHHYYRDTSQPRRHNRRCHPVSKYDYDGYGHKVNIGGTMCYDRYGRGYVVPGSRYVIGHR